MTELDLLLGFLKVGLFAFGGGYGAVPLIRDVVRAYGWMGDELLTDMIAVSESTPGPIMVNLATAIGGAQAGIPGALIATAAVVLPSFVITLLVMVLLKKLLKYPGAQAALSGVKAGIVGIILATGVHMLLQCVAGSVRSPAFSPTALILAAALAAVYFGSRKVLKKGLSPIALIALAAAAGILVYM